MKKWETMFQQLPTSAAGSLRLPMRTDLHLLRKIWHMFMGLSMATIYSLGMPASTAVLLLAIAFAFSVFMEVARLRIPTFNEKVVRFWCPVMRSCEVNRVSGIPYYILATLLSIAIFPKPVAILGILYLAFGDPMASLIGILYGKFGMRFSNGKSLIGTVAGIAVCFAIGFFYLRTLSLPPETTAIIALVGGIAGGTAELLPLDTDDNFSIPIVSGFVLWLAFIFLGA